MSDPRAQSPGRRSAFNHLRRWSSLLRPVTAACGVALAGVWTSHAQVAERAYEPQGEVTESGLGVRTGALPSDAFRTEPAAGLRYRELFRNTRDPFQSGVTTPNVDATLQSDNAQIQFRTALPDVGNRFNLLGRGFAPEDADVKVGPVYFKLRALTGAILASDNANHSSTDQESGAIAIAQISGSVMAELAEGIRIAASGSLVWLPFKGEFGFQSGALVDDLRVSDLELGRAQASWDTTLGEWKIQVSDLFRVFDDFNNRGNLADFVLYGGQGFDASDTLGNYSFGGQDYSRPEGVHTQDSNSFSVDSVGYSNLAAVTAERLLPGPARLRIRVYHEDLWYNQGNRGTPSLREGASVLYKSERENWRFNPFARYQANRNDLNDGFSQSMIVGLRGPITDQLQLQAYGGWYQGYTGSENRFIAGLRIDHEAGPYTNESLFVGREIDDLYNESYDNVRYTISQILGPRTILKGFVSYGIADDLDNNGVQREEFRAGLSTRLTLGPRTSLLGAYTYQRVSSNNDGFLAGETNSNQVDSEYDSNAVRLQLRYQFTDTLRGSLIYEYYQRSSSASNEGYTENLMLLSLSKIFE